MNHIVTLICEASNGFGILIVGVPPGEDPYRRALKWLHDKGQKQPERYLRKEYKVKDVLEFATSVDGIITAAEYFDGASSYGRADPTRYDFFKE